MATNPRHDIEPAIRERAIRIVGELWPEVVRTLPDLDQSDLAQEVGVRLIRRYAAGRGALVTRVRENIELSSAGALAAVMEDVGPIRRDLIHDAIAAYEGVDEAPVPRAEDDPEGFVRAVSALLQVGEDAWNDLVETRAPDLATSSDAAKWTAIALMWDFTFEEIVAVRKVKANAPSMHLRATGRLMERLRHLGPAMRDAVLPTERRPVSIVVPEFGAPQDRPLVDIADRDALWAALGAEGLR